MLDPLRNLAKYSDAEMIKLLFIKEVLLISQIKALTLYVWNMAREGAIVSFSVGKEKYILNNLKITSVNRFFSKYKQIYAHNFEVVLRGCNSAYITPIHLLTNAVHLLPESVFRATF